MLQNTDGNPRVNLYELSNHQLEATRIIPSSQINYLLNESKRCCKIDETDCNVE